METDSPPHQRPKRTPKKSGSKWEQQRRARRFTRLAVVAVGISAIAVSSLVLAGMVGLGPKPLNTSLHQHPILQIYVEGQTFQNGPLYPLPANIGIDPSMWKDHTMDQYAEMGTMSPIHTHDSSGEIHLEMSSWHPCTLGDFFSVWGQPFDRDGVLSYRGTTTLTVDGQPSEAFRGLVLQHGQQIVIRVFPS